MAARALATEVAGHQAVEHHHRHLGLPRFSIGHNVTLHGCKIRDFALIGMGATVMDEAEVGEGALVAAGSVVLSKTKIGPHEMWAGAPAKFVKMMEPEKSKELNEKIARNYLFYSKWYTDPDNAPL